MWLVPGMDLELQHCTPTGPRRASATAPRRPHGHPVVKKLLRLSATVVPCSVYGDLASSVVLGALRRITHPSEDGWPPRPTRCSEPVLGGGATQGLASSTPWSSCSRRPRSCGASRGRRCPAARSMAGRRSRPRLPPQLPREALDRGRRQAPFADIVLPSGGGNCLGASAGLHRAFSMGVRPLGGAWPACSPERVS